MLVHHFTRGFGHAKLLPTGKWEVFFFDDYNKPVLFSDRPQGQILKFFPEGGQHGR
jgi:hypothetical protein